MTSCYQGYTKLGTTKTQENQNNNTYVFSGEGGREEHTAGAAVAINNKILQHIEDIEPMNDRIMYITAKGALPIITMLACMPKADGPTEENTSSI